MHVCDTLLNNIFGKNIADGEFLCDREIHNFNFSNEM